MNFKGSGNQLDLSNCNRVMTECLLLRADGSDGSTHDQKHFCLLLFLVLSVSYNVS